MGVERALLAQLAKHVPLRQALVQVFLFYISKEEVAD